MELGPSAPRPAHRLINVVDAAIFAWITGNVDPLRSIAATCRPGMRARGVKPTGKLPGLQRPRVDPSGNVRMFWDGVWEKPWGKSFGEDTARVLAENAAKVRDEMILRAYRLGRPKMEQRGAGCRHLLKRSGRR